MLDRGHAPAQPRELPVAERRGEAAVGASGRDPPVGDEGLMERVVERGHRRAALRRVQQNAGSPGIDGMTVEEWPGSRGAHGLQIPEALRAGTSRPPPVKRGEIPTPGGGVRTLGMPTVRDRCLQQARRQVVPPEWETTFADGSDGGRPGRSAHQAIARAPRDVRAGDSGVVDLDVETCFDRVHHDQLMRLVQGRGADRRV
jgi:RNA-directed DNA polymerase